MTLRNTLIATAIAALGASAWAQGSAPTDPLKKPAAPALTMPSTSKPAMPAAQPAMPEAQKPSAPMAASTTKAPDKAAMKHEKHASKATHKKHKKAHPKQDMHKTMPEPARAS